MRYVSVALLLLFAGTSCTPDSKNEVGKEAAGVKDEETSNTAENGWVDLFDGKSFDGWKVNEKPETWSVKDGALVANGDRSHLYYVGDPEPFVNFELEAVVMTLPSSNSGIYIHTKYQDSGWPKYGYEVQVNNSHGDPQKTGGLYGVVEVLEAPAKDGEWFTMLIRVDGKHIVVKVDGKTVTDYTEPEGKEPGKDFTRALDKGTFALQGHDPGSTVSYKSIRVRRLP